MMFPCSTNPYVEVIKNGLRFDGFRRLFASSSLFTVEKTAQGHVTRDRRRSGPCRAPRRLESPPFDAGPICSVFGGAACDALEFWQVSSAHPGDRFCARQLKVVSSGAVAPVVDVYSARLYHSCLLRRSPAEEYHGRIYTYLYMYI